MTVSFCLVYIGVQLGMGEVSLSNSKVENHRPNLIACSSMMCEVNCSPSCENLLLVR